MLRRVVFSLTLAMAAIAMAGSADAQQRRQLDATPFSHAPCSVLDGQPCTPSFCSVFNDGPCIPEIDYPYGQNLQLTIESAPPQSRCRQIPKTRTTTSTASATCSRRCGPAGRRRRPPAAREGMQMSVRFSFKRTGEIIGTPRVTFATAGVPAEVRATYLKAINASLNACAPLKFTGNLGGAIAGRPIAIRYVDNRDLGRRGGEAVSVIPSFGAFATVGAHPE